MYKDLLICLLIFLFGKHVVTKVDHVELALKPQGSCVNPFLSFYDTSRPILCIWLRRDLLRLDFCANLDEPGSTATRNDLRNKTIKTTKFILSLGHMSPVHLLLVRPPQGLRLMKHPPPGGLPDTQADDHLQSHPLTVNEGTGVTSAHTSFANWSRLCTCNSGNQ